MLMIFIQHSKEIKPARKAPVRKPVAKKKPPVKLDV
jgi:hypothetical protein